MGWDRIYPVSEVKVHRTLCPIRLSIRRYFVDRIYICVQSRVYIDLFSLEQFDKGGNKVGMIFYFHEYSQFFSLFLYSNLDDVKKRDQTMIKLGVNEERKNSVGGAESWWIMYAHARLALFTVVRREIKRSVEKSEILPSRCCLQVSRAVRCSGKEG